MSASRKARQMRGRVQLSSLSEVARNEIEQLHRNKEVASIYPI